MKTGQIRILIWAAICFLAFAGQASAKTVSLSWDASPTTTVTGYEIYYASGSTSSPSGGTGAAEGNSPVDVGKVLSFTLTGLPDDQAQSFAVVAYDANGNRSILSNVVESSPIAAPPVTTSPAGDKQVTLSWDPSPTSTVTGYRIYYALGSTSTPTGGTGATEGDSPVDVGNVLTYTLTGLQSDQVYSFAVVAYDASGNSSSFSNVVESSTSATNTAPVLAAIGSKSILESTILNFTLSASDADGDTLSYSATGLPTGANFNSSTGTFSWTPSYDQAGSYPVTFTVSDGTSSDSETITINVTNVNRAPTLATIGAKTAAENASLGFTVSATDPDNDALTYTAANLPAGASFNGTTGAFNWTPGYDQAGNYSVTFSASDGSSSDSEVVNINVTNVDRAPVLTVIDPQTVAENAELSFTISATDPDNDNLSFSVGNLPAGASFDAASGAFSWTPGYDQAGSYSVDFTASDGSLTATQAVSIAVADVNRAPVLAAIGSKAVAESALLSFNVSASDPDNDSLSFSAENLPAGASFNPTDQTFSWTPAANQEGSYTVTFSVSDGTASDSEQVAINVNNVNQAPVLAAIGTKSIGEGELLSFVVSGSDPDGDGLSFSAENLPSGASFDPQTKQFSWTPPFEPTENTRIYPVTFTVSDGALSDSETVTINVTNVNRAPVLEPIGNRNLQEGDSLNLVVNATDPDGNPLQYSAENLPAGAVFIAATRSLSWIPSTDQAGSYQITFTVSDGSLSDFETITLNVANANQAPVLDGIGSQNVNEGEVLSLTVTATDPEGDALTYSAEGLPAGASFDPVQRLFRWTPGFDQAGDFSVTFRVSDGNLTDAESVAIRVVNVNQPPTISGSPAGSVMATTAYSFTPNAEDPDSDSLTYSISNKPSWADFDAATGKLSGTPDELQVGTSAPIEIGVSDGFSTVYLPPFTIEVQAFAAIDTDGDGVFDHEDAFPNDPNEWLDTDSDLIGNNADTDDDNDGVPDIQDGAPLDASRSGWLINAVAGTGGYITPEGETSVVYGGSQAYTLTPMAGYFVSGLLVDQVSIGARASYQFSNVTAAHTIEAVFAPIPTGLSLDPVASGLPGVEREDGGNDQDNLVDGLPKLDLEYAFEVVVREPLLADQLRVYLVLDSFRYPMQLNSGALANGARYQYTTRLGPAFEHRFYFLLEDQGGAELARYPQSGELSGPLVDLLVGRNLVGTPNNIEALDLDAQTAFNTNLVYRWIPSEKLQGSYERIERGGPVKPGEGYVLKRASDGTLPSLDGYGDVSSDSYEISVDTGWNLIANPYKGNVSLADVQVIYGSDSPVPWLQAAADNLLVDGIYYYLGDDWGGSNAFESAAGSRSATLTPWIGYWIYVNPADQPIRLLIPRPQQ